MLEPVGQGCVSGHFFVTLASNYLGFGKDWTLLQSKQSTSQPVGPGTGTSPNHSISYIFPGSVSLRQSDALPRICPCLLVEALPLSHLDFYRALAQQREFLLLFYSSWGDDLLRSLYLMTSNMKGQGL